MVMQNEPPLPRLRATRDGDDRVWDYVVVEFMPGGSLANLLEQHAQPAPGTSPRRERLRVLRHVAAGLHQMPPHRSVPRDLQPAHAQS